MKKLLAITMVVVMGILLIACGGNGNDTSESSAKTEAAKEDVIATDESEVADTNDEANTDDGKPFRVAFWPFNMAEEFGIDVRTGVENACAEAGYEVIALDPQGDLGTLTSQMEDMITEGVDAMIFAAIDGESMDEIVKKGMDAGIVMVDYDCTLISGITPVTIKSDDEKGGADAAKIMAEKIGGEGTILVYEELPGVGSGVWRNKGFREYIAANYPNISIINNRPQSGSRADCQVWAIDMLAANPDIKGIFTYAGDAAIGSYYGTKEVGREDVIIVGYDATPEQQEIMINDGPECNLVASIALFPQKMGRVTVEALTAYLNGEFEKSSPEDIILIDPGLLTAENASTFVDED